MDFEQMTFEAGLALVAKQYAESKLVKVAFDWSKITEALKGLGTSASKQLANPWVRNPLIGAGIGGGLGLASTALQPKSRRDYLGRGVTGALLGGLGGASANLISEGLGDRGMNAPSQADAAITKDINTQMANTRNTFTDRDTGKATWGKLFDYFRDTNVPIGDKLSTGLATVSDVVIPRERAESTEGPQLPGTGTSMAVGGAVGLGELGRDVAKRYSTPGSWFGGSRLVRPLGTTSSVFKRITDNDMRKAMQGATDWLKRDWGKTWGPEGAAMQQKLNMKPMSDRAATLRGIREGTQPAQSSFGKVESILKEWANPAKQNKALTRLSDNVARLKRDIASVYSKMTPANIQHYPAMRLQINKYQKILKISEPKLKAAIVLHNFRKQQAAKILTNVKNVPVPKTVVTPGNIRGSMVGAGTKGGVWRSLLGAGGKGLGAGGAHMVFFEQLKRLMGGEKPTPGKIYADRLEALAGRIPE